MIDQREVTTPLDAAPPRLRDRLRIRASRGFRRWMYAPAAVALVVGMVSIGGLVLIVPVVIVLLHTQRYLDLVARRGSANPGE